MIEEITKTRYKCTCEAADTHGVVCAHKWESDSIPDRCAKCKKATWNRAPIRYGRNGKQIVALGKSQTLAAWSRESGVSVSTIHQRIKTGWTADDAILTPTRKKEIGTPAQKPELGTL